MDRSSLSAISTPGYIMSALSSKQKQLQSLAPRLTALETSFAQLNAPATADAIARFRADSAAARFHLHPGTGPAVVAILGGTGTGKSTLLNRLVDANISAASFRRTHTAGAVAVTAREHGLPAGWLGVDAHMVPETELPARGRLDQLVIVSSDHELLSHITLIDTPDLDGDQPVHHLQADRAFRWAQAVLFLVTPEKYQMPELTPYYRLAQRYGVPTVFVMNKAESRDVLDDFTAQLSRVHGFSPQKAFCIPRDDSQLIVPDEQNLNCLKTHLRQINIPSAAADSAKKETNGVQGLKNRLTDLLSRARDQVLQPLLDARAHSDRTTAALRSLAAPEPNIDVHPITTQLQRRLQQKSVLYLMGPRRVFDRVRQVPLMLARLPRSTWDLFRTGTIRSPKAVEGPPDDWQETGPDFQAALADQLRLLQARMDDLIRSSRQGERWIAGDETGYAAVRISPDDAAKIADDELADLKAWLEQRWNTVPRDTRVVQSLLKVIPGGRKLVEMSEAAPYLLTVVVASHHAMFGGVDLLILGGYSLATWLTEKLSNEVAGRAKLSNERIATEYTRLAQRQIDRMIGWIDAQSTGKAELNTTLTEVESLFSEVERV